MSLSSRSRLGQLYRGESNPKIKERLLLILRTEDDRQLPSHVVKELHRSKPWASYWLDRYNREGIEGLRDKPKSGRPTELPKEIILKIRKKLSESKHGWNTKQVNDIIVKEGRVCSTITLMYADCSTSGVLNRKCQERYMSILHLRKRKMLSKKSTENTRQFT